MHIPVIQRMSPWQEMSSVPLCLIRKRGDKTEAVNDFISGSSFNLQLIEVRNARSTHCS